MVSQHQSVMLDEAVQALITDPDGFYVDGTFGRGGHSREILKNLKSGLLLAVDKDPEAMGAAQALAHSNPNFIFHHGSFARIPEWVNETGRQPNGILLDLGVSSPQLDQPERGFSFLQDGPLDMRMDTSKGQTAAQWLAGVDEKSLADVFFQYGEERYSRRIARAVIEARRQAPIISTQQLAEVIKTAHPRWEKGKHPATRCFQAIRIWINQELEALKQALQACEALLMPGGRLVVISFHSLEDRLVKKFLQGRLFAPQPEIILPLYSPHVLKFKQMGKVRRPAKEEIENNPRARSAVMRIGIRVE